MHLIALLGSSPWKVKLKHQPTNKTKCRAGAFTHGSQTHSFVELPGAQVMKLPRHVLPKKKPQQATKHDLRTLKKILHVACA